jgi:release factor glutamine methyltransferase
MLRWTTEYLGGKGLEEPRLNAELLLAGALGIKRLDLYLQFDRPLTDEEIATFKAALLRRARREPLQYIAGHADFRQIRLMVDTRVLIPRPETELLVGEVLRWAAGRGASTAVDIGTGSGAIALSLATEGAFSRIVATDISEEALAVARANLELIRPPVQVELRHGFVFDPLGAERFDVIVSNPPYIGERERDSLDVEVRNFEPAGALFSGTDGLDAVRAIVQGAPRHLERAGLLALEIGASQGQAVVGLIRATGQFAEPLLRQDLAGRDRMVIAELLPSPAQ